VTRPKRRWIVDTDAIALGDWVQRFEPDGARAVAEGRVFVDARRVVDARHVVHRGACLELYATRQAEGEVRIVAEQGGLIAAFKPALLATEPDKSGAHVTLLGEAARLLGCAVRDLHALSRLDVGVSGVVLLARRGAGGSLPPPLASRRRYVAIAGAAPAPPRGTWTSAIAHGARGARPAETRYAVVRALEPVGFFTAGPSSAALAPALLALAPITGRTHQLRIHAERSGAPLLGDRAYGGSQRLLAPDGGVVEIGRIALHALAVEVTPAKGPPFRAEAPASPELVQLWQRLGGDERDFQAAERENLQDKPGGVA
jgi:23S rRNA-/tRNA-specific pseudouridylate synthase